MNSIDQQNQNISDISTSFHFSSNDPIVDVEPKVPYVPPFGPLEDVETDIDNQTDPTTATTSSRIASSNANDNNLNFEAAEFVPQCATSRGLNVPPLLQPNAYMMPPPNMYNNATVVQNYMNATGDNQQQQQPNNNNAVFTRSASPIAMAQNVPSNEDEYIECPQQETVNEKRNDFQGMDVTEIIRLNPSLTVLLANDEIVRFIKHQNGSRFMQEALKRASNKVTTEILRHLIFERQQLLSCSEDVFGNWVIQMFFQSGSREHHRILIEHLLIGNVYRLSRSSYGCRVIQTAFDCIRCHEQKALVEELENEGKKYTHNDNNNGYTSLLHQVIICGNANHVIQKILSLNLPIENIQFIIDAIKTNVCYYASHIFGCRIVQSIINFYGDNKENKLMLSELVTESNLMHLCQSGYGNYVIQHILNLSFVKDDCAEIKQAVIRTVFKNTVYLSKNKHGSQVVEKCLLKASHKDIDYLLDTILLQQNKSCLINMVEHEFANYVIQRLLKFSNDSQRQRLMNEIECNIPNLRELKFGKHIMDKMKKLKQKRYYRCNRY